MEIENVDGQITVRPGTLDHFTQHQEQALKANGFHKMPCGAYVSSKSGAQYAAETIKVGGIG